MKRYLIYLLIGLLLLLSTACKEKSQIESPQVATRLKEQNTVSSQAPQAITRTLLQAGNGDLWMATFDGIYRYNGQSFSQPSPSVSSSRFFALAEDRQGYLWFGSLGSGVYRYDGSSWKNFTTQDGLVSNEVVCIYEDPSGDPWFGTNGGASRYDGRSFHNYLIQEDTMVEDRTGITIPGSPRPPREVNAIVRDTSGHIWLATRGRTFVYDGQAFTTVTRPDGQPFRNVRWLIKDQKNNLWLGGQNGLWRHDGTNFTPYTSDFVGYIYEDSKGDIWTSSQSSTSNRWVLSRYDVRTLYANEPKVTVIPSDYPDNQGMIFGITEVNDGSIWFGGLDGVYRYDGEKVKRLK